MNGNNGTPSTPSHDEPKLAREYKELFGAVRRRERSYWTRIGAAFVNRDGSLNLRFDFFPTDPNTTIQLREPREARPRV